MWVLKCRFRRWWSSRPWVMAWDRLSHRRWKVDNGAFACNTGRVTGTAQWGRLNVSTLASQPSPQWKYLKVLQMQIFCFPCVCLCACVCLALNLGGTVSSICAHTHTHTHKEWVSVFFFNNYYQFRISMLTWHWKVFPNCCNDNMVALILPSLCVWMLVECHWGKKGKCFLINRTT